MDYFKGHNLTKQTWTLYPYSQQQPNFLWYLNGNIYWFPNCIIHTGPMVVRSWNIAEHVKIEIWPKKIDLRENLRKYTILDSGHAKNSTKEQLMDHFKGSLWSPLCTFQTLSVVCFIPYGMERHTYRNHKLCFSEHFFLPHPLFSSLIKTKIQIKARLLLTDN